MGGSAAEIGTDLHAAAFCGCAGSWDSRLPRLCGTVYQAASAAALPEPGIRASSSVQEAGEGAGISVWLWVKKEFSLYALLYPLEE